MSQKMNTEKNQLQNSHPIDIYIFINMNGA